MNKKIFDQGSQSRAAHAAYNFGEIYPVQMLAEIPKQGVAMDIGTGVGRDAVAMHNRVNGRLLVVGIDPDESNYYKAVETYPQKDIVLCHDWAAVAAVKRNRQIAYLVAEVQKLEEPPSNLKADFINCSAVMMFIPRDEQQDFLHGLHSLAKPLRDVFLRYRTEMLKNGMTSINQRILFNQCYLAGFAMRKLPDFPDPPPSSRDFVWHDYLLTACCKPKFF
ncbi:MAG: class I SAM-dependent methyltransferase [Alphaproteobacteria bacterium]|nr:class I SAM-dependent methyltransferase [Alphaproteobacteria bacterium]